MLLPSSFSFTLTSRNFSPSTHPLLWGAKSSRATWSDLVWAAVTVGKKELSHVLRYGFASEMEFRWRLYLLFANLQQDSMGLIQTDAFKALDPSEKSAVSYFMGLTMAKLCVQQELDVPWLMHLDVYKTWLQYQTVKGLTTTSRSQSQRPDLVGRKWNGDWISVEAKGRSGAFNADTMKTAKAQARKLISVRNQVPSLSVALLSCFLSRKRKQRLVVHWQDPEPEKEVGWRLDLEDEDEFFKHYYAPFLSLLSNSERFIEHQERRYRVVFLAQMDVIIGLDEKIILELKTIDGRQQHGRWAEIGSDLHRHSTFNLEKQQLRQDSNLTIGGDGVMVRVGPFWSSSNMRLPPDKRSEISGSDFE